ncbi:MAG TPA: TonB-dependent receptor [Azospirillaceae bacterium]|nr:TonB-dependent receptor [Azospirillaceae bacterium]
MKHRILATLAAGVSLAALTAPGIAAAQTAPAGGQGETAFLEEIIVTARKRVEQSQDVPLAMSAFSNETLERQGIEDPLDLQFSVPNLLLVGNDRPTIRGVGNNAISSTADNGTGVLLNFVPIGTRTGDEFFDLERIEVLRGPQGTLYGRNTTGGTINVITAKPTDEVEGYVNAQYGNFDSVRLHGAINLPLADAVQQRFAAFYLKRDGYTKNLGTGNSIDGRDQYQVRSSTRLNVSENTRVDLVFNYSKEDSSRSRENKRLCKATPNLGCSPFELGFDSPDVSGVIFQRLLAPFTGVLVAPGFNIYAGAPNPTDLREVAADTDSTFKGEQTSTTLEISHEFGDFSLISLSGHSWGKSEANTDFDNAALPFRFLTPVTYTASRGNQVTTDRLITTDSFTSFGRTWYQEFRIVSDMAGPFNFTVGGNYFDTRGAAAFEIWHPAVELIAKNIFRLPDTAWNFFNGSPYARTKSWAGFGEGYYNVTDDTKVTVGLRYTEDKKAIRTRTIFLSAPPPFTVGSGKFDAVTGRVSLDHKADLGFTDETLLFASYSRGFKSGGLNAGSTNQPTFKPEKINAYEIGAKNTLAGGRLQANLSAFYYDYSDLQLGQRTGTGTLTVNGDADIMGVEGEFLFAPTENWLFNTNIAFLDTEIGSFQTFDPANPAQWNGTGTPTRTPAVLVDLKGKELPYAPDTKITIGGQYTMPVGGTGWDATLRGDYSWQSSYWAREFNTPNDKIKSWSTANITLRFTNEDSGLSLEAFVRNIANEDNITNSIIESDLVGSYRNVRILEPRTYGLQVQYKF